MHVCHHMASEIPFYHAKEATVAVRKAIGRHYHIDDRTPLLEAFWTTQRDCQHVEETNGAGALHRAMAQETQFVTNKWRPVLTIEIMRGQIEDP
jgi:fatty acid desaturase